MLEKNREAHQLYIMLMTYFGTIGRDFILDASKMEEVRKMSNTCVKSNCARLFESGRSVYCGEHSNSD
jgi:hypothetical protein